MLDDKLTKLVEKLYYMGAYDAIGSLARIYEKAGDKATANAILEEQSRLYWIEEQENYWAEEYLRGEDYETGI